jgi:transglutaminase-like putative cysteine protease
MPSDHTFRLSTYLTLAIACVALGYAEWDYLPEVTAFSAAAVIALVAAFRTEGRFTLSLTASNWVGGALCLLAVGWIAMNWRNDMSLIHTLPWPAGLLPFLGPVVMAVVVAKLFRPKHVGDWWGMQGLGLAAVGLAGSLSEDLVFFLLLGVYAVVGVWSLTLFYHRRTAGLIPPVPPADPNAGLLVISAWFPWLFGRGSAAPVVAGPPPQKARAHGGYRFGRGNVRRALGWLAVAGLVALPLFFLTPRSDGVRWQLGRHREVGYSADLSIDVGRVGELQTSQEVAFEVTVTDAATGAPRDDFPTDQRWRGTGYTEYHNGRWSRSKPGGWLTDQRVVPASDGGTAILPNLGPGTLTLEYRLSPELQRGAQGSVLLADPIVFDWGKPPPLVTLFARRDRSGVLTKSGIQQWDTSFNTPIVKVSQYRQAYQIPADRTLGVPFEKREPIPNHEDAFAPLRDPSRGSVHQIETFAKRTLNRLAQEERIPKDVLARRENNQNALDPADYRVVAEALRDFLAHGGEYTYSLTTTRSAKGIDPIEDFLLNTKTGHCERFASALVLMLRSVGIPSMFVLGFKGCDPVGEGKYLVRQEQAHAWAEAVIPTGDGRWQILSLDPSPTGAEDSSGVSVVGLWEAARTTGRRLFSDYIIGLTPDSQQRLVAVAEDTAAQNGPVLGVLAAMVLGLGAIARFAGRRLRRARPVSGVEVPSDAAPWFTRMVALLNGDGRGLAPGQTPAEYARRAATELARDPALAAVADVPVAVALAVYEVRFAGRPLAQARLAEIERDIDRLAAALRAGRT